MLNSKRLLAALMIAVGMSAVIPVFAAPSIARQKAIERRNSRIKKVPTSKSSSSVSCPRCTTSSKSPSLNTKSFCSIQSWKCTGWSECKIQFDDFATQDRQCNLVDLYCMNGGQVKPETYQICKPSSGEQKMFSDQQNLNKMISDLQEKKESDRMSQIIDDGRVLIKDMDSEASRLCADKANQVYKVRYDYVGKLNEYIRIYNGQLSGVKSPLKSQVENDLKQLEKLYYGTPFTYCNDSNIYIVPRSNVTAPSSGKTHQQMCDELRVSLALKGAFGAGAEIVMKNAGC